MVKIEPRFRYNIALNAHPIGCDKNIQKDIKFAQDIPKLTNKKLTVLIIGGSSGYGLACRVLLGFNTNAIIYNVSFERASRGKNSASAGYYNNHFYQKHARSHNIESYDYNGDAFSDTLKERIINDAKQRDHTFDFIVYSLASGIRIEPTTGVQYTSVLKPIGTSFTGYDVDIVKEEAVLKTIEPATEEEIDNTVKVMGGEDYERWITMLDSASCIQENAHILAFTYQGSQLTYPIYREGTIGHAKKHLHDTHKKMISLYEPKGYHIHLSSSKTIVSKASVFIPTVPLYASALFKVMKVHDVHESIIEHKYRLLKSIFNNTYLLDDDMIRLDNYELSDTIQIEVKELMDQYDGSLDTLDFSEFVKEFIGLNGFGIPEVDYEQELNLDDYEV